MMGSIPLHRTIGDNNYRVELQNQIHYVNDFGLLDGGYPGLNGHCVIPIRKPVHQELDPECASWNRVLSRARSRVERQFAVAKRYQILQRTTLEMGTLRYVPSCVDLAPATRCACSWRKRPREE